MALRTLRSKRARSRSEAMPQPARWTSFFRTPYRPNRVVVLLIAVAIMSVFDLLLTLTYLTEAGMMESNPFARVIMVGSGATGVILWKSLTVSLTVFILFIARKRLAGELGAVFCCVVLGWLMARWETYTSEAALITSVINSGFRPEHSHWVSLPGGAEVHTDRTPMARLVLRSEAWDEPTEP